MSLWGFGGCDGGAAQVVPPVENVTSRSREELRTTCSAVRMSPLSIDDDP